MNARLRAGVWVSLLTVAVIATTGFASAQSSGGGVKLEAESGTPSGQVEVFGESGASNGSAVRFLSTTSVTPLPTNGNWSNVTGNLQVSNRWVRVFAKPGSSDVITATGAHTISSDLGVWSHNGSGNWVKLGQGSGSASVNIMGMKIQFDPSNPNIFWLAGMYGSPTGFYKTTNGGQTFQKMSDMGHNDFVSVDLSDPNRNLILLGSHERGKLVMKSTDGGLTWTNIGVSIPGSDVSFSSHPIILNSQTYVVDAEASWSSGDLGIYRTTNGGTSWTRVSSEEVSDSPTLTSSGHIYFRGNRSWATTSDYLLRSTNGGQTWSRVSGQFALAPIELPDGRLITANQNKLIVSGDGITWTEFGPQLPCGADSIAYSTGQQSVYITGNDSCSIPGAVFRLK